MKPRVQQKLDQISSYPFFETVGKPLPDSVTQIKTWRMAATESSKLRWGNCQLQGSNILRRRIQSLYPKAGMWERFQEWNPLVDELRPLIDSIAERLLARIPLPDDKKIKIKHNLTWDFMATCLEIQYNDIVEPDFFIKHIEPWYAAGHFPCGWDGRQFPDGWDGIIRQGKLMVF